MNSNETIYELIQVFRMNTRLTPTHILMHPSLKKDLMEEVRESLHLSMDELGNLKAFGLPIIWTIQIPEGKICPAYIIK